MQKIKIHDVIKGSTVNGPGNRYVIWTQGCSKKCPNCYNPEMWDAEKGHGYFIDSLITDIINSKCDGVTISGGDPFEQEQPLFELLWKLNQYLDKLPKGIIVFTGYTKEELAENSVAQTCINLCDLVIEGRYIDSLRHKNGLSGSSNQRFIYNEKPGRGKSKVGDEVEIDQDVEIFPINLAENEYVMTGFPLIEQAKLKELGIEIVPDEK